MTHTVSGFKIQQFFQYTNFSKISTHKKKENSEVRSCPFNLIVVSSSMTTVHKIPPHRGLIEILNSESEEALEQLSVNFTATRAHFGALHTIELESGGEHRMVTMTNREEFVHKLHSWHLTGPVGGENFSCYCQYCVCPKGKCLRYRAVNYSETQGLASFPDVGVAWE